VVTTGGGNGVIATDVIGAAGLTVPALSPGLSARIETLAPETGSTGNPVDLIGTTLNDARLLVRVVETLMESDEVDAVAVTGSPLAMWHGFAEGLAALETESVPLLREASARCGKPLVLNPDRVGTPAVRAALEAGIPVYRDVESAAGALARLAEAGLHAPEGVPEIPEPAGEPVAAGGYWAARELLGSAGVSLVDAVRVASLDEARAAAAELGYPVVLKALGLLHKSEAGGVVLGIDSEAALGDAFSEMATRLSPEAYSVERTAPLTAGLELIVGCRRDPRFGPVALAGIGGIYAELLADVQLALAPIDETTAERLLRGLRAAPLLAGFRGRPAVDVQAAARALATVSRLAAARPEIAELEVNPLLVTPAGALALDARVVLAGAAEPGSEGRVAG
jgi:acyl-CoA synthetase (NDP forming)